MEALFTELERGVRFRRKCLMVVIAVALLVIMIFVIPASDISHDIKLLAEASGGVGLGVVATRLLVVSRER